MHMTENHLMQMTGTDKAILCMPIVLYVREMCGCFRVETSYPNLDQRPRRPHISLLLQTWCAMRAPL